MFYESSNVNKILFSNNKVKIEQEKSNQKDNDLQSRIPRNITNKSLEKCTIDSKRKKFKVILKNYEFNYILGKHQKEEVLMELCGR